MQTFFPVVSIEESARILDNKRAWKQCVECSQIITVLETGAKAWSNHPAVLMWKGYVDGLKYYYNIFWWECVNNRGVKAKKLQPFEGFLNSELPPWVGNERFHASHRSNLLRKDRDYYSKFGWTEPDNLEYVWPSKELVYVS
jgi:hypothetical protein